MLKCTLFYSTILLALLFHSASCKPQLKPLQLIQKKHSNSNYIDAIIDSNIIWGLTDKGKINLFTADSGDYVGNDIMNDSLILFITKDKEGSIIIGDNGNYIKQYNKNNHSFKTLAKCPNNIEGVTFDSENNYYLLTDRGVFDMKTNKIFYPDSSFSLNRQIRLSGGWFGKPVFMTDKKDNIWMGFGYGEWGGDLFVFNTVEKRFIKPLFDSFRITLNPVKSIFESDKHVYISCGLMHFSTSGSIVEFDNFKGRPILESNEYRKRTSDNKRDTIIDGEYIGPGSFNAADNCIYFYSQNGVFKGNADNHLPKIEYWTKIFTPTLHWSNGQPDAVVSPMNVLKLSVIKSGIILFVSQNDGIGLYEDGRLIMMR